MRFKPIFALLNALPALTHLGIAHAAESPPAIEGGLPLAGAEVTSSEAAATRASPSELRGLDFDAPSISLQLGLIQPVLLGGANVEADFRMGHLVVDYSHGWNLNLDGSSIIGEMSRQKVSLRIPYTTGFGFGYSAHVDALRSTFDIRFEPKLHRFEASFASADGSQKTSIVNYTTVTLGGGAYWTLVPFSHRTNLLRGLNVSTSLRFWPKVATTLSGNEVGYNNTTTGQWETHKAANIGIADTPLILNVSLGYIFQ